MNSRVALEDAEKLIVKLTDRTREGKIVWTESSRHRNVNALETSLEAPLKAIVWVTNREAGFRVSETKDEIVEAVEEIFEGQSLPTPGQEKRLLSISVSSKGGYDYPEEERIYIKLIDLHELARRSAYKIDAQFENINDYLDRLAG